MMELYIDLLKSLNRANLVLKKVAVHMPSGKVAYENRWVDPRTGESPTQHPSHTEIPSVHEHKWNDYHNNLNKKQKAEVETRRKGFSNHVEKHTGNKATEQDLRDMEMEHRDFHDKKLINPHRDKDIVDFKEDGSHHDWYHPDVMDEVRRRHSVDKLVQTAIQKAGAEDEDDITQAVSDHIMGSRKLKNSIVKSIQLHIDHDPHTRDSVKEIQRKATALIQDSKFGIIGSDPHILKQTLRSALGGRYDKAKEKLANASISMNVPPEVLESVAKNGYRPVDILDKKRMGKTPDKHTPEQEVYEEKLKKLADNVDNGMFKNRKPFTQDPMWDENYGSRAEKFTDHYSEDPYLEEKVGKTYEPNSRIKKPDGTNMSKQEIEQHNARVREHTNAMVKPNLWDESGSTTYRQPQSDKNGKIADKVYTLDEVKGRNKQEIENHRALRDKHGLPQLDSYEGHKSDFYSGNIEGTMTKLAGEHVSAGLHYLDARPSYFSLNPDGNPKGPADLPQIYGKACFNIDEKALANCTVTRNGIQDSDPIPKVHSTDHATDLYLMKLHEGGHVDSFLKGDKDAYKHDDIIPLEFMYHNPEQKGLVEPELMKMSYNGKE